MHDREILPSFVAPDVRDQGPIAGAEHVIDGADQPVLQIERIPAHGQEASQDAGVARLHRVEHRGPRRAAMLRLHVAAHVVKIGATGLRHVAR